MLSTARCIRLRSCRLAARPSARRRSSARRVSECEPLPSAELSMKNWPLSLRQISRQLEDRPADFLLGLEPIKEFQP